MKADTIAELLAWQPPQTKEIIAQGILVPGSRMCIYGLPETYKSMLAMYTGMVLSRGQDWLGFRTTKSSVLLAQVEIPKYKMRERVEKYVNANSKYVPTNFHIMSEPTLRLDRMSSMAEFEVEVARHRPQVLIFDPLYRLFSGDLSDNTQLENLLDSLDVLAAQYGLAVILIGHRRKPSDRFDPSTSNWGPELIGGSYTYNWVDTAIAVEKYADTTLLMHFAKVRHATDEMKDIRVRIHRDTLHFVRLV